MSPPYLPAKVTVKIKWNSIYFLSHQPGESVTYKSIIGIDFDPNLEPV